MTSSAPLIIVSLPGRSISELRRQALLAHAAGADLAEVRVDRLTPEERSRLPELFPAPLPLIATLRSRAEGGEGVDAPDERARQLLAAANLPFRWIDLEEARDSALEGRLPPWSSLGRILSSHLPEGTAVTEALERLHRSAPAGCVRKVVVWATVGSLLHDVLPRLEPRAATSIVVLTTGPSGGLLRAWSRRLGFPFVYASPPGADARAPVDAVEPSQVPVDRLRPFFQGGDEAPIFAVTGHPVAHSQSPYLHSRWMRARRQTGLYISLDISEETEFLDALAPLADRGFRGLNVTHPWKAVGLNAASRAAPGAARCGAANCLTFRDGEVEAENTDLVAILRRLEEFRTRGSWDGRELAVVGAGGAAAATLAAAQELGVDAAVIARREDRAVTVARRFGAAVLSPNEARPFPLVVHATTAGRDPPIDLAIPLGPIVGPGTQVLDWVYSPTDPVIRRTTEQRGGQYEDGWRLLVYQAAASYGIWWGEEPDAEEIEAAIAEGPCTA